MAQASQACQSSPSMPGSRLGSRAIDRWSAAANPGAQMPTANGSRP